jgi:uncharacterized protein YbjQ (UPF0145 family)
MPQLEYLTTYSSIDGYRIVGKPKKRITTRGKNLARAEENLIRRVQEETKGKANCVIDIRYYETLKGNIVMSGTPAMVERE